MREVVIASGTRTAIGDFGGGLKDVSCLELGKTAILGAMRKAGIEKDQVDEVIMGNVLPCGLGQNPARQAMLIAGLPVSVSAITVNKVCGSGLKAVMLAAQAIALGDADTIVAGGMESMFHAPYYLEKAREGYRLWDGKLVDSVVHDGLWDIINDFHMGFATENVAQKWNISREAQDGFAFSSYEKAQKAVAMGQFKEEIVPVEIPQKKGPPVLFNSDEGLQRKTSPEALAGLPPVFKEEGTITAGNSSKLSDGAAAVVVMAAEQARRLGVKPLARILSYGSAGIDIVIPTAAPIYSIPRVLKRAGLEEKDIDLHEINEAFAASALATIKELGIKEAKVNVNGGAIAMGHPLGCSGARVLVTLLYALKTRDMKRGVASLCIGGGEAVSMVVERVS